jgi:hypothetical protein
MTAVTSLERFLASLRMTGRSTEAEGEENDG